MLKRQGGVWMNGTVELTDTELRFSQSRMIKSGRSPALSWSIALGDISDITFSTGVVSETLLVDHNGDRIKLMTVRAADFVGRLKKAVGRA
jgi:hypothetical protein